MEFDQIEHFFKRWEIVQISDWFDEIELESNLGVIINFGRIY